MGFGRIRWRVAVGIVCGLAGAPPASALELVGSTSATFRWGAASGPVSGYAVYVARDGAAFPALPEVFTGVAQTAATIAGVAGETVVVRVAAFDAEFNLGPFSPNSEPVSFVASAPPPTPPPAEEPAPGPEEPGSEVPEPPPAEEPTASPPASSGVILYSEDFEAYAGGEDPDGWFDTGKQNSLLEDPTFFETFVLPDDNVAFGTSSRRFTIHSHWLGSEGWSAYEFRGRMQIDDPSAGIGVTLYSDYPNSDSYYRLRRLDGNDFRLAPHGEPTGSECAGSQATGVLPQAGEWYHFRVQALPEAGGTRLRAKVWAEHEAEPGSWPVDCHAGPEAFASGKIGLWATSAGSKYWDDLEVVSLEIPAGEGEVLYAESFDTLPTRSDPHGWFDTRTGSSLSERPLLFETVEVDAPNRAFSAEASSGHIHSHLVVDGSETWSDYEVAGRMRVENRRGGIGVTLYSAYPSSDRYYRLRRRGGSFHVMPRGGRMRTDCVGATDSGVNPQTDTWYRFRFQALSDAGGTRLRAKVWTDGLEEPASWSIDCLDAGAEAYRAGRPGVWSKGDGRKFWDDLIVRRLRPDGF